ncbi:MAG: glycine cleavage system protein GcvH [Phycisphaerales bacterium]|nr:glycine cleavage system protein GcvH [Phycisphaerales bacterium]
MSVPADRRYSQSHEWFKVDGKSVTIGITQFAADELTDITYVDVPKVGVVIESGSPFGEVESVKATSDLFSAVTGKVVEVNQKLANQPELLNTDPFNDGWIAKLDCQDLSPLDNLLDGPAYDKMIAQ